MCSHCPMAAKDWFTGKKRGEKQEALPARGLVRFIDGSAVNENYKRILLSEGPIQENHHAPGHIKACRAVLHLAGVTDPSNSKSGWPSPNVSLSNTAEIDPPLSPASR